MFEPSNDAIDFHADADTEFVVGSAAPHAHDLVLGRYSVHTSPAMLRAGERRLNEIQHRCRAKGDSGSGIPDRNTSMSVSRRRNNPERLNQTADMSATESAATEHLPNPVEPLARAQGHDEIARRAYQLFEERGGEPGRDWEDWFRAEREL